MRPPHALLGTALALCCVPAAFAWPPPLPTPPQARLHAADASLPDGAVARLGSARFRYAGLMTHAVEFTANGRRVAVMTDQSIWVFDVSTGRLLHQLALPDQADDWVMRVPADGRRLAVVSRRNSTPTAWTLFDLDRGEVVETRQPWRDGIEGFTAESFRRSKPISLWDLTADGKRRVMHAEGLKTGFILDEAGDWRCEFRVDPEAKKLRLTPNDARVLVLGSRSAVVHSARSGSRMGTFSDPGPGFQELSQAASSADGMQLAVVSVKEDAIAFLDARGPVGFRRFPTDQSVHRAVVSPDGRYLVGLGVTGSIVWDVRIPGDKARVATLPGGITCAFTPDGKTLALPGISEVSLWSVGRWQPLPQSADPPGGLYAVAFSADGTKVIGHTPSGWLAWPATGGPGVALSEPAAVHASLFAELSADGRTAIDFVRHPDAGLRLTDFRTGKTIRIPLKREPWGPVRVSADGRHVLGMPADNELVIWNAASAEVLHRQSVPADRIVLDAEATPDGTGLARSVTGIRRQSKKEQTRFDWLVPPVEALLVVDYRSGRGWKVNPAPSRVNPRDVRLSRDRSRLVASGVFDSWWERDSVGVWDCATGRLLMHWPRDPGPADENRAVASATLSTDGRSVAVGDHGGHLHVVEVSTGAERAAFRHCSGVISVAFSPSGLRVAASSAEAPVYVWDLLGRPGAWDPATAGALWADLASTDARSAFGAVRRLRFNPREAVAFLKQRLAKVEEPDAAQVKQWLNRLEYGVVSERETATNALAEVAPLIRATLEDEREAASAKVAPYLDRALNRTRTLTPGELRQIRACEVLEGIGSAEARELLRSWAKGADWVRLTAEAKASLARLPGAAAP